MGAGVCNLRDMSSSKAYKLINPGLRGYEKTAIVSVGWRAAASERTQHLTAATVGAEQTLSRGNL